VKNNTKTTPNAIKLDDIIALIPPPFEVARKDGAPMADTSVINIKCEIGHIHKFYIADIYRGSKISCLTCSGNKFVTAVRKFIEGLSGEPFTLVDSDTKGVVDLINESLKVQICCGSIATPLDGWVSAQIKTTTSARKISATIKEALLEHLGELDQSTQLCRVMSSTTKDDITTEFARPRYVRESVPYTDDTANVLIQARNMNPIVARMTMNILPKSEAGDLCLENCMAK
jgi:hypothetical protein